MAAVSNSALITPDGPFPNSVWDASLKLMRSPHPRVLPIPCVGEHGMLRMWIDGCKRSGVKNFMVIAIDDEVRQSP